MSLLRVFLKAPRWDARKVITDVFIDVIHDLLKEAVPISFQRQEVITFAATI